MMITASGEALNGSNLLDPGKTPHQNMRFLLMLLGVLKGVYKHSGLLRAGIASSGNDHRLGANEAPPAIISVFLGDLLNRILNELESGKGSDQSPETQVLKLGVSQLPEVMKDNTDRNRTSPFAFTGNKFEFRAVGSSASPAFPITLLNAAVADGFSELTATLKQKSNNKPVTEIMILEVIREAVHVTKSIRFEGNNYSEDWVQEAHQRGLPHLRKTPEALAQIISASSKEMLTRLGVFSEAEIHSRFHVRLERYLKNMMIEVDTLRAMVDTQVLPAAFSYQGQLAQAAVANKTLGLEAPQTVPLKELSVHITQLQNKRSALEIALQRVEGMKAETDKANGFAMEISTIMHEIRILCDGLEAIVSDDLWPLLKYREILFLS
jgi:glutamine synthetase